MIPHIFPLKYPFFFVPFTAALLTPAMAAKAFWSVAVIVVSAALINYNKYLMNPSRHVARPGHYRRVAGSVF